MHYKCEQVMICLDSKSNMNTITKNDYNSPMEFVKQKGIWIMKIENR